MVFTLYREFLILRVPDTVSLVRLVTDDHLKNTSAIGSDGRSTRWANHRAARRTELARAARKAIHHAGPELSMDDIAAAAQTSKSMFYRYFTDKTGLQAAVGELVLADIAAVLEQVSHQAASPQASLHAMIDAYLEMIETAPNVYRFVTQPSSDAAAPVGNFLAGITELVARPVGGETTTNAAWAAGVVGFVRGVGEWWLAQGHPVSREELAKNTATSLWQGAPGATTPRPSEGKNS